MTRLLGALARWVARVLRWFLLLMTALLALGLLALALALLLAGWLWAILRGRRPSTPVVVGRFARYSAERVWPGRAGVRTASETEVVDVEVTEVAEVTEVRTLGRLDDQATRHEANGPDRG